MKACRFIFAVLLGILIVATISALTPQAAYAQTCYDPQGLPVPCPREKKTKIPTRVPPSRTPTPTSTPTSTPTPAVIVPPGGDNPAGNAPAAPNPGPGLPGGLGMLILVMIIGILFTGGVFIARFMRRGKQPGLGGVQPGPTLVQPGPINLNADAGLNQINDNSDAGPIQTNLNEGTEGPGNMNQNE